MRKALLVARWEFRAAVFRRAYFVAIVATPALFFALGAVSVLTTSFSARSARAAPIGVVDKAGILDIPFAAAQAAWREQLRTGDPFTAVTARLTPTGGLSGYADESRALDDLAGGYVSSVYVIENDYLKTGRLTAYGGETTVFGQAPANQRLTIVSDAIRASLLKKTVSADILARTYAPGIRLTRKTVDPSGAIREAGNDFGFGRLAGTFGVFALLTMSIFFSAGFLQQATIEDRQNRVFEVLLSSVDADSLILGKIFGLGGAGLLQVAFYVALILAGSSALPFLDISIGRLALSIVYFVIGYLLFASLMAAVGMIARTAQESAQLSALWTVSSIAPMFFMITIVTSPNGLISRLLSFFPLSSAVTMLLRLTTTTNVPATDIVVSIVIGVLSVYAALRGTVRIFRAATLMYGKRPTLPELMRWLRAT